MFLQFCRNSDNWNFEPPELSPSVGCPRLGVTIGVVFGVKTVSQMNHLMFGEIAVFEVGEPCLNEDSIGAVIDEMCVSR